RHLRHRSDPGRDAHPLLRPLYRTGHPAAGRSEPAGPGGRRGDYRLRRQDPARVRPPGGHCDPADGDELAVRRCVMRHGSTVVRTAYCVNLPSPVVGSVRVEEPRVRLATKRGDLSTPPPTASRWTALLRITSANASVRR